MIFKFGKKHKTKCIDLYTCTVSYLYFYCFCLTFIYLLFLFIYNFFMVCEGGLSVHNVHVCKLCFLGFVSNVAGLIY